MAIREIVFTVAEDGQSISPATPQDGGVQGEHNATRAVIRVGTGSVWENPDYRIYIECEDNAGNVDITETLEVNEGQVSVLLPLAWTQYGGIDILRLVAEDEYGDKIYAPDALVRLTARQNALNKVDGLLKGRLAQTEACAKAAAEAATAGAAEAAANREGAIIAKNTAENAATGALMAKNDALAATAAAETAAANAVTTLMGMQSIQSAAETAASRAEAAAQACRWVEMADDGNGNVEFVTVNPPEDTEDEDTEPVYETVTVESAANAQGGHVLELSGVEVGTVLTVETTGSKVFCGGKNLCSINNFTVTGYTINETGEKQIAFDPPLPPGQYFVSAEITLGGTAQPLTQPQNASGGAIAYSDAECTVSYASPQFKAASAASYDRAYFAFYATEPFAKLRIWSSNSNANSSGVTTTFANFCITAASSKEEGIPYAGDYTGVVCEATDGTATATVTGDPMYLFADDSAAFSVSYEREVEVEDTEGDSTGDTDPTSGGVLFTFKVDGREYDGFCDPAARNDVKAVEEEVAALKEIVKDAGVTVALSPPDYYTAGGYLQGKVATINDLMKSACANGDAFIFITDQHTENNNNVSPAVSKNAGQAPSLIKYICDNTKVRRLFSGGDVGVTPQQVTAYSEAMAAAFNGDIHYAMGNHEYDALRQSDADLYYTCDINKTAQIGNALRHYYYVDNPQQKLRYVVINPWAASATGADGTTAEDIAVQAKWLTDTALNVEEGWGIILFSHGFFNGVNATNVSGACEPYYDVIDNYAGAGEIIAVFQGHIHRDMVNRTTKSGVPVIGVASDGNYTMIEINGVWRYSVTYQGDTEPTSATDGQYWFDTASEAIKVYSATDGAWSVVDEEDVTLMVERRAGTITEQAFDVVIVDRTERKLHCVRIGADAVDGSGAAGSDRVGVRVVDFRETE